MTTLDLLHGDCLEKMKDISAGTIDCFVCDLPYGCLSSKSVRSEESVKQYNRGAAYIEQKCSWDVKLNLEEFWTQVKRLRRNKNTPVLMFCNTRFGIDLINSNPSWFRYDLVWDKGRGANFLCASQKPLPSHEMVYVFSELGAYYRRVNVKGNFTPYHFKAAEATKQFSDTKRTATQNDGTTRCPRSVIQMPNKTLRLANHPTEKPRELYKWLIERYCPPGGTILDPTAGSFNSCFAAYELNRNSIGIEKDDTFFLKACERADKL